MRKLLALSVLALMTCTVATAANKASGSTTLKDFEPVGTTDKDHKKQQYDLIFESAQHEYVCRTPYKTKVKANDFVVGSQVQFKVSGNKGNVKSTESKKSVKCTVVRVEKMVNPAL